MLRTVTRCKRFEVGDDETECSTTCPPFGAVSGVTNDALRSGACNKQIFGPR
jgi:hypothetical protein